MKRIEMARHLDSVFRQCRRHVDEQSRKLQLVASLRTEAEKFPHDRFSNFPNAAQLFNMCALVAEYNSVTDEQWEMILEAYRGLDLDRDQEKRETNIKNAERPRKKMPGTDTLITKADAEKKRDDFEKEHTHRHGWKKVACAQFDIDIKTLNKIMRE